MGTDWDESFAGGRVIMMRLYRVPDLDIPLLFHRRQSTAAVVPHTTRTKVEAQLVSGAGPSGSGAPGARS